MKTHRTAVVLIPPEAAWPPIQAIRQRHDRHARRWMPHVTLLYPFRPAAQFAAVLPGLGEAVAAVPPFDVALRTIRYFDHGRGRYTWWLAPEPAAAVDRLQAALQAAAPGCDDVRRHPGGFTPHLSLGQAHGRAELERLLAAWQASWQPIRFRVDRVHLLARGDPPEDVFAVVHTLPLGREGAGAPF